MSLRARVLVGLAFVAVVLGTVALAVTLTTRAQLLDQVDRRLAELDVPRAALRPPRGEDDRGGPAELFVAFPGESGLVVFANVQRGDRQLPAPDIDADDLAAVGTGDVDGDGDGDRAGNDQVFRTVSSAEGSVTYRVLIETDQIGTVVYGVPIDDVQRTINRLIWVTLIGSAAILSALALVAWWVIRLGVRPIKEMTVTAGRIARGDREVRIPEPDDRTESGALAVALNRMVASMNESLDARTRSEEQVRQFVADASHELRTPVTTIRGYAELYRHGGLAEPAALDDAMRRTEQEAARMGRLVEDMLTLARLDEQRPLDRRPVDLSRVADDAASDARASSPGRPVVFDSDGPAVMVGDEDRLRQVVANVVGNALVHTSPEVAVTLRTGTTADEVWLDVIDEGTGMAPEVAARITERFFRADPARARHRGGSGLGLSIVESAVAAHGGHVVVTSAPGAGTTVRLSFPSER